MRLPAPPELEARFEKTDERLSTTDERLSTTAGAAWLGMVAGAKVQPLETQVAQLEQTVAELRALVESLQTEMNAVQKAHTGHAHTVKLGNGVGNLLTTSKPTT